jgi:alpha-glucosidase
MNAHPPQWTAGLHHDGSALYVSKPLPALGDTVQIRLRVPANAPIVRIVLRSAPDGEQHLEPMREERRDAACAWWVADLPVTMPTLTYRFFIVSAEEGWWLNAQGVSRADSPDSGDFKLIADFEAPDWLEDAVFYQIFPDRFYNGDPTNDVPEGAWERSGFRTQRRAWGLPPLAWKEGGSLDFYGGDLQGIAHKLDYLTDLGVTGIFLNPIFTAHTNHRYDIVDYQQVDPHVGGDEGLAALRAALDEEGMRLILDVTPNHCGHHNRWFLAAQADPAAPTAEYFTFHHHPDDYETWLGHRSLVKLNYASQRLRDAMYRAPDSVMRYWLRPPYRIDGWRLDVANMTARQGVVQMAHEVWREMRRAVKDDQPQAYLFGENFFDGTPHLQGDELDAVMNYQGFSIPVWRWLRDPAAPIFHPLDHPQPLPAEAVAEQWTRFRAAVPYAITQQQFNQLCSHDTPRILMLIGGRKPLLKLATALLMTFPGVPCIYYGDEIGMEGARDPDNRRCMRWDETTWDHDLHEHHKRLIRLRREAPALRHGGFQMIAAEGGLLAYQREAAEQRLLVIGWRGPEMRPAAPLPVAHAGLADGARLREVFSGQTFVVQGGAVALPALMVGAALILEAQG